MIHPERATIALPLTGSKPTLFSRNGQWVMRDAHDAPRMTHDAQAV
jgi:hypothetical protein